MFSKMKSGIAFKESVFLKIKGNPRGPVVATKKNKKTKNLAHQ